MSIYSEAPPVIEHVVNDLPIPEQRIWYGLKTDPPRPAGYYFYTTGRWSYGPFKSHNSALNGHSDYYAGITGWP